MQSFLQSRRLGLAAKAQVERDLEKGALITRSSGPRGVIADAQDSDAVNFEKTATEGHSEPAVASNGQTSDARPVEETKAKLPAKRRPSDATSSGRVEDEDDSPESPGSVVQRVQTVATQYSTAAALGHSLTGVHVRDRQTHEGKGEKVFIVGWEGPDDPLNPRNWTTTKRILCILEVSTIALVVGAASGIDATILPQAAEDLGVSDVAETLDTGLYLVGMGLGGLIAGPFSETFGRNAVYTVSMAVFMIWIMAAGLAPNYGAQIIFRLFAGCSASTPLVCSGGSVADMFNSIEKTWGFPIYAISSFGGPMLGAVMGAYIGPSTLVSWRWSEWTILIFSGLITILLFFCMPETYEPLLLGWKAKHLRKITGDSRYCTEHEIVKATLFTRLKVSMTRPFLMLTEPIILAMALYLTVLYIVLFTFLVGWPYIFDYPYDIGQGLSNIVFISMFVGLMFSFFLVPIVYRKTINQMKLAESRGEGSQFDPESRLWYAMLGCSAAIPISLFWMGWTSSPSISIWSPILAAALFGYGIIGIFLAAYMYIIDSYEIYSASALTFVALTRYVAAGGMTVVGLPFYKNMGVHYTLTILGSISAVLVPIPYLLYKWGYLLRRRSKYAVSTHI
ncbi:major facilitator superfamily transporter [Pseudomassariella vexata]|uniref:Major facilitator superfamily transporter n=1 Tax=Pseudomassariella vexata TaxID=1141098 RepID=A0A1Y2DJD2_9PEZI|nr:major facilitator superfamily transporter [Pseudomassariella vexata]ORY59322.1 major facilitator superfamily transporter [Pseudomassariella vexata]